MKIFLIGFIELCLINGLIANQEAQGYKLFCPMPESIMVKDKAEYLAPIKYEKDSHHKTIIMKGLRKDKLDLSALMFVAASVNHKNVLACLYEDSKTSKTLTLLASLPRETPCTVIYPKGHKHPNLIYFECGKNTLQE